MSEYLNSQPPPAGAYATAYGQQQQHQQYPNQQFPQQQRPQQPAQQPGQYASFAPSTSSMPSASYAAPAPAQQQQHYQRPIALSAAPPGVPQPRRISGGGGGGGKGTKSKAASNALRSFDLFGQVLDEDFVVRHASGGVVTAVAAVLMFLLFVGELKHYLHGRPSTTLSVDSTRSAALDITFDVTMHRLPCSWLTIDAMDSTGGSELDVSHHVHKRRIDDRGHGFMPDEEGVTKVLIGPANKPGLEAIPTSDGTAACGSCYGAGASDEVKDPTSPPPVVADGAGASKPAPRCCATCEDVLEAYKSKGWMVPDPSTIKQCHDEKHREEVMQQRGEGCHVWGTLRVPKVAGSFHLAPGLSWNGPMGHTHDLSPFSGSEIDVSHTINKLSFGPPYPGQHSPLDGAHYSSEASSAPGPAPSGAGAAAAMLAAMNGASPDSAAAAAAVAGASPTGRRAGAVQYFLKVVPTTHTQFVDAAVEQASDGGVDGTKTKRKREVTTWSSTFSVAEHVRSPAGDGFDPPGVFFFYDVSPLRVRHSTERPSFASFAASACAVVGGVWSVAGVAEAALAAKRARAAKKVELGKAN